MGDPNCTLYDEDIPYDAVIPYDGICTSPVVENRPIFWVGKRSFWEKEKEEKQRRRKRLVVAISSEIFSVNDTIYDKNEPNRIRVAEDLEDVSVAVSKLMSDQPRIDVRSRMMVDEDQEVLPTVSATGDISELNRDITPLEVSGGLPNRETEEEVDEIFGEIDEDEQLSVESRILDEDGDMAIVCEVVTNEKDSEIITVEADNDRDEDK